MAIFTRILLHVPCHHLAAIRTGYGCTGDTGLVRHGGVAFGADAFTAGTGSRTSGEALIHAAALASAAALTTSAALASSATLATPAALAFRYHCFYIIEHYC
jgi:hypothetical protein